jgi:acetyltransferase-like isoleucine patch superfamily enzyme
VNIAGICEIEDKVVIGAGSVVLDKIKIGKSSIIGAGSVVTKNIPDGVIAYGSPAKVIRDISD